MMKEKKVTIHPEESAATYLKNKGRHRNALI
jgi:hypothetical protein